METKFQGLVGVCMYLDDILVTGSLEKEHLAMLMQSCSGWKPQKEAEGNVCLFVVKESSTLNMGPTQRTEDISQ